MSPADVHDVLDNKPFRPFVIFVSDGSSFEVHEPGHVIIMRSVVIVGYNPDDEGWPQRSKHLNIRQITRIEILQEA